jgi:acetyl-CoA carboxylase biotin carboxyl carrier protein
MGEWLWCIAPAKVARSRRLPLTFVSKRTMKFACCARAGCFPFYWMSSRQDVLNQQDRKDRMAIVDVKTEITGNVWKIVARVGQKLAEDEPILILESMKMEIPVSAPEAGTVKEILVAEGDVATEGSVVARIEA